MGERRSPQGPNSAATRSRGFGIIGGGGFIIQAKEEEKKTHITSFSSQGMDPLSIAAGVVGVVTPALHGLRLLADDIGKIRDVPNVIRDLGKHVAGLEASLVSLQAVSEPQWESLGESVAGQAKAALTLCGDSCDRFRASMASWTRHSDDGDGLSWRDRTVVGFFKQGQIKSMTAQLQSCNIALTAVVAMATL